MAKRKTEKLTETELDGVRGGGSTAPSGLPSGTTRSGWLSNSSPGGTGKTESDAKSETIRTPTTTITYTGLE